jgi:hypothetical protein
VCVGDASVVIIISFTTLSSILLYCSIFEGLWNEALWPRDSQTITNQPERSRSKPQTLGPPSFPLYPDSSRRLNTHYQRIPRNYLYCTASLHNNNRHYPITAIETLLVLVANPCSVDNTQHKHPTPALSINLPTFHLPTSTLVLSQHCLYRRIRY